jgi:hypothetical protein
MGGLWELGGAQIGRPIDARHDTSWGSLAKGGAQFGAPLLWCRVEYTLFGRGLVWWGLRYGNRGEKGVSRRGSLLEVS